MNILLLTKRLQGLLVGNDYIIHLLKDEISLSLLFNQLASYEIITYSVILGEIDKIYNDLCKTSIQEILSKERENIVLYTPRGALSQQLIYQLSIKELDFQNIESDQFTIPISEECLQIHKIQCMLNGHIKEILSYILSKPKFLLKYLEIFIVMQKIQIKIGYYLEEDRVVSSVEEGLEILVKNQWIVSKELLFQKIKYDNIQNQSITYCNCNFISYKNISNQVHFNIHNPKVKYNIPIVHMEKRELILPLKKEVEITNPLDFYKLYVLKCMPKNTYKKFLKAPKLRVKKTSRELIVKY